MNPARSLIACFLLLLIVPLVMVAFLATSSDAYWGYPGCCGCQETWCAWSATWHGPYALDTPLRGYYVPRMPGRCDRPAPDAALGSCGCGTGVAMNGCAGGPGCNYPPAAAMAFEPVQFERLGQVPNDMELSGLGAQPPPDR